jgi:hypothetical protein
VFNNFGELTMYAYPENIVRMMHPQIVNLRAAIAHHFKHRHDGRGNQAVRNWIAYLRRVDKSGGYSEALAQISKQ